MKRFISALIALAMILSMVPAVFATDSDATTLYLQPNENWLESDARFAAYFFGNGELWLDCTDSDADGIYEVAAPAGYPNVIFCRMNPATTENNWSNKWNQTNDLTVPTDDKVCYVVVGWDKGAGSWVALGEEPEPIELVYYLVGSMNDWSAGASNAMTANGDGTFSITMDLAAGTYTYKVTTSTGEWYPDGADLSLTLDAAASVTFTINGETKEITHVIPTAEKTTLDLGDNEVHLDAGDFDGNTWTFTAAADGNLTVTVTALAMPNYNENDELVMTPVEDAYLDMVLGMQYQFYLTKNGEAVDGTSVNVVAGDVIAVTLVSNQYNETEATLTLTLGETVVEEPKVPGTSAENPIIIESLPYEVPVDGVHNLYFAYTAAENCTLLISFPTGGLVTVDNWNEGPSENTRVVDLVAGATTIINLWSNEAVTGTYTIALLVEEGPISGAGTYGDPYVITVPDAYTVDKTGSIYWEYTATESGKLTFTVTCDNWNYFNLRNTVSGVSSPYIYPDDGTSYTIELYKGDTVSGFLYATNENGETSSSFALSFEACEVDKTVSVNAGAYYLPLDVIVDANSRVNCQVSFSTEGASVYVVGSSNNYYVMIGETKYEPDENGKVVLPLERSYDRQTVYLYNTGDEAVTITYNLAWDLGHSNNPDTITDMGDYTVNVPEGYGGYNYTWTAPESGKLTFTILEESNWSYAIENVDTGVSYYYPSWNDDWTEQVYITTVTIDVNEGDEVILQVMHEDNSAGELKFNLSFVAGAVEQFHNMTASSDTNEVTPEVAPGASIRYEILSYLSGGQLTITGTNFYVVVGGTGVYNEELGVFLPEGGTRYDPVDGVVAVYLADYSTSTLHIVNTGSEAATYTFGTNYPTGTEANPDTITDSATITLPENAGAYYFTYTATGDGYIIVTITSEGGVYHNVYNASSYMYPGEAYVADASKGTKVSLPVYTGDAVTISVNTWDVDDSVPGGDITVSVTFVPAVIGGFISCSWSGEIVENETFEIPANSSAVYVLDGFYDSCATITGENFYVLVNGEKLEPVNGTVTLPAGTFLLEVVNTADTANTFTAGISYPLGSQDNPEVLTMGDHTASVPLYGYYWYTFTATEAGTVKLEMTCNDWYITEWNTYSEFSSEGNEDPSFEVAVGDELALRVSTVMGNAGTITFTASFTPAGEGGDDEVTYLGDGEALVDGDNHVEVEAESSYGAEWYHVAEVTGNLTISVTDLQALVDGEWGALALRALGTGSLGSSVTLYVNDQQVHYDMNTETATLTVGVTAGDVVLVTMASATGAGLRATLNLACVDNTHNAEEDGTLILGNNSISLPTGGYDEDYNPLPGENKTYTFTATEAGTLIINLAGASYTAEGMIIGEMTTTNIAASELFTLMEQLVTLTVNGETYVPDIAEFEVTYPDLYLATLDVKVGDQVVLVFSNNFFYDLNMILNLSMTEEEAGPTIIDELPAELVAEFADADTAFAEGMQWQYTAAQDGVIEFINLSEGAEIWVSVNDGEFLPVDGSIEVKAGDVLIITMYGADAGTFSCFAMYAENIVYGDVNGDGNVNYLDAYLVMNYSVGNVTEDDLDLTAADVNNDGSVNYLDAYLIMNFSVGNIESFPVDDEN